MHPENYSALVAGWTRREVRCGRMREEDALLTPAQKVAHDRAAAQMINALFNSGERAV